MLIGFDLDGTLIEGHLTTTICDECGGTGRAPDASGPCEPCKGKGQRFGEKLPYDPVTVLPGRRDKVLALARRGHDFFIATNQGGVAFGFQTYLQVETKIALVMAEFNLFHGRPISTHVAFWHPDVEGATESQLGLRKPAPGMLREAMLAHRRYPADTLYVGDLGTDRDAAEAAGCAFVWADNFF